MNPVISWSVYALKHPRTGQVCYVGWTSRSLKRRLQAHVQQAVTTRRKVRFPLLDSNIMQAKIARRFGVSRTTVSRWKLARAQGSALKRLPPPGRPPRMAAMPIECCKSIYRFGPLGGGEWTQAKFAQAIRDNLGVE